MKSIVPILTVLAAIVLVWYAAAVRLNAPWEYDQAARAQSEPPAFGQLVALTMRQDRPVLPAPHQVLQELVNSTLGMKVTSKRSLVYHSWITISGTLLGFAIGTTAGILLAVGIVSSRTMDLSVMPWAIAVQTIPIVAIAPTIVVVLSTVGLTGLFPKAVVSAFLTFFPVLVGMVKGLRSPDQMQLDLLATYSASKPQTLWKLRLPASVPYLFASLKVGIAASLVGAIVGELSATVGVGIGGRLLSGSYYGQTLQIWAALFAAAIVAATLVSLIGLVERISLRRMGMRA